jgi:hypothetical protein
MTPLNHSQTTIGSQRSTVEAVRAAVAASVIDTVWRRTVGDAGEALGDVDSVGVRLLPNAVVWSEVRTTAAVTAGAASMATSPAHAIA